MKVLYNKIFVHNTKKEFKNMRWIKAGDYSVFNLSHVTNLEIADNGDPLEKGRWVNACFATANYSDVLGYSQQSKVTVFAGDYIECREAIGKILRGEYDMKVDYKCTLRTSRWVDVDDIVFDLGHVTQLFLHCYDNQDDFQIEAFLPISLYDQKSKYATDCYIVVKRGTEQECEQLRDDIVYGKYDIQGV